MQVRQICHIALKRDHEYINTVEEGSEDTHAQVCRGELFLLYLLLIYGDLILSHINFFQVRQTHLVAPLDKHFSLLYTMLKEHIADDVKYKVSIFGHQYCELHIILITILNLLYVSLDQIL